MTPWVRKAQETLSFVDDNYQQASSRVWRFWLVDVYVFTRWRLIRLDMFFGTKFVKITQPRYSVRSSSSARAKWVRHFQIRFELKSYISEINDIDSVHAHVPNSCFENAFELEQPNLVGLLKKVGEYHFIILGQRDKIDSQVHYTWLSAFSGTLTRVLAALLKHSRLF